MSLKSTYTNASIRGWSSGGNDGNYPWSQTQIFGASGNVGKGNVAVSGDGNYFVVAGTAGSSYATVYVKIGSIWSVNQTIATGLQVESVGIDYSGSTFVIGAFGGTSNVYSRAGSTWSLQQTLTGGPGASISQDGNYISTGETGVNVRVYLRSGSTWSVQQTITPPVPSVYFGLETSINDTNGDVLSISDRSYNSDTGRVLIYTRSGTTWTFQQSLQGSNTVAGDIFGFKAILDSTGQYCLVLSGGTADNRAYLFEYSGGVWNEIAYLTSPIYGNSIAMSAGAQAIAIGLPEENSVSGEVLMYYKVDSSVDLIQTITFTLASSAKFGYGVALSNSGAILPITAISNGGITAASNFVYTATIF